MKQPAPGHTPSEWPSQGLIISSLEFQLPLTNVCSIVEKSDFAELKEAEEMANR